MTLRLKILAWTHITVGALGLTALASIVLAYASARSTAYDDEFALFGGGLGLLSIVYFLPSFLGGIGLLRKRPWARPLLWAESAVLALAIPIGTVLAGFGLWALVTTRAGTADGGMANFEAFVHRALRPLILFLIALVLFGLILGLGYLFRDVIDPPGRQVLTPLPGGMPPQSPAERQEFREPVLPVGPER